MLTLSLLERYFTEERREAEPIILRAPCTRGKDQNPSHSPASAPCCALMEVCPQFPSSPTGADSDGGFPICLGRGGQKESGNSPELSSRADLPACLPGTPRRLPSSSPSAARGKGPTGHREEAQRVQLPVSPLVSQTWGSDRQHG